MMREHILFDPEISPSVFANLNHFNYKFFDHSFL